ncbi:hypothetical protein EUX98_g4573 [Antrodiella citrinella]|uniref:Altered inheritance of mitochondria protein 41 n=1 Tax=Antrodiella citrinella TaxID=2447956 RepID=A0A4S4MVL3_9APHY|nr:hypothetical protein EUX98_g4573 [Antrodiella citrinella]
MFARAAARSSRSLRTSTLCRTQLQNARQYTVTADEDVRAKLTEDMKAAMKAKDTTKTTIIRSTLAEVYAADKKTQSTLSTSAIQALIVKGIARRKEAAKLYQTGNRIELAEKEILEIPVLTAYLPPQLPKEEVDRILQEVITTSEIMLRDPTRAKDIASIAMKKFFEKVDKMTVDKSYVRKRAVQILEAQVAKATAP